MGLRDDERAELVRIASKYFGTVRRFGSFESSSSGSDFFEVAIWTLDYAMTEAYEAGKRAAECEGKQ